MSRVPGFFQEQVDPVYNVWFSGKNVQYIQKEVARRMGLKYAGYIEPEASWVMESLQDTYTTWNGPLTLNELLEMVICNFVQDINTDIEWTTRFNHCNPRTLYHPGTGITREEKVKLNPGYKFEFQMNY